MSHLSVLECSMKQLSEYRLYVTLTCRSRPVCVVNTKCAGAII